MAKTVTEKKLTRLIYANQALCKAREELDAALADLPDPYVDGYRMAADKTFAIRQRLFGYALHKNAERAMEKILAVHGKLANRARAELVAKKYPKSGVRTKPARKVKKN